MTAHPFEREATEAEAENSNRTLRGPTIESSTVGAATSNTNADVTPAITESRELICNCDSPGYCDFGSSPSSG